MKLGLKINKTFGFILVFLLGFLSAAFIGVYLISGFEVPVLNELGFSGNTSKAPNNFIEENQIEIFEDKIVINVKNAGIDRYAATGSMIPLLDEYSNGIRIVPKSEDDVNMGDVIIFENQGILIVHRIIEKGIDKEGIYFITKGDNNFLSDGKIRFKNIKYKVIGVIW